MAAAAAARTEGAGDLGAFGGPQVIATVLSSFISLDSFAVESKPRCTTAAHSSRDTPELGLPHPRAQPGPSSRVGGATWVGRYCVPQGQGVVVCA